MHARSDRSRLLAALSIAALTLGGCASNPATRTVTSSDTTTQTAAGGMTQTTIQETHETGPRGAQTTERIETVRTTVPPPPRPGPTP